jgi:hypothetical protein
MSYLQINSVEQGFEWYKSNTKYPDEVCEMLAKYEWRPLRVVLRQTRPGNRRSYTGEQLD